MKSHSGRQSDRERCPKSGDDTGAALITVVMGMSIMTTLLVVALYVVLANSAPARRSQDVRAAYAAAQAGVDEYLARLNGSSGNYWLKGNTDPTNPALTATGAGQQMPGQNSARFRYQLLNAADVARTGRIVLQSTGISGPIGATSSNTVSKTLTATLAPQSFSKYVYFSDLEVIDPSLNGVPARPVTVDGSPGPGGTEQYAMTPLDMCSLKAYEGRTDGFTLNGPTPPVGVWDTATSTWVKPPGSITSGQVAGLTCGNIVWGTNDILQGPMHSNDQLTILGAVTFTTLAESSWPFCKDNPTANCWAGGGTPAGTVLPTYAPQLALPQANSSLKVIAQDQVKAVGCYYTGATTITITGNRMTVFSPNTTSAPARCFNPSNRANPQTVALPQVIYVDQVAGTCEGVGFPREGETTTRGFVPDYSCNRGTAMVQGTVNGQVTVGALDDIVITGDLTYANGLSGTDITGLVAGNFVWVSHPVTDADTPLPGFTPVYNIQAAIMALRHSFLVQNYSNGGEPVSVPGDPRTYLNVTGSITQRFRGPVGTFSSEGLTRGYSKNYVYDERLTRMQPPYFLQPSASPWSQISLSDG